jgi:hypothetical protein
MPHPPVCPCPNCRSSSGSGWLVLLAVAVLLVLAAASAAREAVHILAELIPWACGAIIAVIAAWWLGYAAHSALRARHSHARTGQAASRHAPARPAAHRTPQTRAVRK